MLTVSYLPGHFQLSVPMALPSTLDAWRALLGGPIDICDCDDTIVPCMIVCLFQTSRVVSGGASNDIASILVDEPIFGPAVLVAGTSAVEALDEQFAGWDGDEPEMERVTR